MNVQIIDIIVGAILAYGLVHGYYKGIVQQLGSLGGLIVAILFANLFTPIFENLLNKFDFATHKLAYLTSFLVLLFGCNFLARLLKKTLHMLHLGWFDRITGSIFCCFKYLLVASALLNLYTILGGDGKNSVPPIPQEARLCQIVLKVAPFVIDWSKEKVEIPDINISLPEINKDELPAFLQ